MKQLICNIEKLQTRVALVENNRLEEYYIERNDVPRIVGSIFKGRIRNLEASLQAAFVDIGLEKNAFLHYWDMIPATIDRLEEDDETDSDEFALKSADDHDHDHDDEHDDDDDSDDDDSDDDDAHDGRREARQERQSRRERQAEGEESGDETGDESSPDASASAGPVDHGDEAPTADEGADESSATGEARSREEGASRRRRRGRRNRNRGGDRNASQADDSQSGDDERDDASGEADSDTESDADDSRSDASANDSRDESREERRGRERRGRERNEPLGPDLRRPRPGADDSQAPAPAGELGETAPAIAAVSAPVAPVVPPRAPAVETPRRTAADDSQAPRSTRPPTVSGIQFSEAAVPPPRKPISLTEKLKRLFTGAAREKTHEVETPAAAHESTPAVRPPVAEKPATPAQIPPPAAEPPSKVVRHQTVRAERPSREERDERDAGPDDSQADGNALSDSRRAERPAERERNTDRDRGDRGGKRGGKDGGSKEAGGKDTSPNRRRRPSRNFDLDEIPKKFSVNSEVIVQVTKGMIGEKGPRVTTNLSMPGRYTVLLPNSDHRGVSRRIEDRKERTRLREVLKKIDLPRNMGLICRTAGIGLTEEAIRLDVELLMEKWIMAEKIGGSRRAPVCVYQEPNLLERTIRDFLSEDIDEIVVDTKAAFDLAQSYIKRLDEARRPRIKLHDDPTPIFQRYRLVEQIGGIFRRKVALASGAELAIDETEALIAIDINSGRSRGGKDHPETILKTNLEAAEEVARQLRLRNIGGLVVVDFIDMRSRRDQLMVYRKMHEALSRDRAKTKILPLSKLGLMEMTRQREHESLQDTIFDTCPYCRGRGLVKSATTISVEIQRRLQELLRRDRGRTPIRVVVHPRVLDRLKTADANILRSMEKEFGGDLSFRSDPSIHQEAFHLIDIQSGKEL